MSHTFILGARHRYINSLVSNSFKDKRQPWAIKWWRYVWRYISFYPNLKLTEWLGHRLAHRVTFISWEWRRWPALRGPHHLCSKQCIPMTLEHGSRLLELSLSFSFLSFLPRGPLIKALLDGLRVQSHVAAQTRPGAWTWSARRAGKWRRRQRRW